jgi:CheY-like chemotaxis protein
MHGGRVEARSDGPDTGSEFVAFLPVADVADATSARTHREAAASRRDAPPPRRRILIVDDNVDLATSLALMLQMLGHEVHAVHDGPSAIAAVVSFAPDLVFLDIGMPRMSGYEICRRIRALDNGAVPVIVALSGWGQEQDKLRSREAGMDLHLVKPFDPEKLADVLARLPQRTSSVAAPGLPPAHKAEPAAARETAPAALWNENDTATVTVGDAETAVEAARYALVRRILPVLRHGLAGELQGVQFAVNLARYASENGGDAQDAIARIADQAQAAIGRGHVLTEWLRPDPSATTTVGEAVHACLDLVGTEWSLRGIEVNAAVPAANEVVKAAMFRELTAALILAIGDAANGAADVALTARRRGGEVIVSLRARAAIRDGDGARVSLYRDLRWTDVTALARAHGVRWARRGDHVLARIPLA